jgi:hypothetical protein
VLLEDETLAETVPPEIPDRVVLAWTVALFKAPVTLLKEKELGPLITTDLVIVKVLLP